MTGKEKTARYRVFRHIQENLMDMVDDGKIEGEELAKLNDSMGEIANLVLDCMGLEIQEVKDDDSMIARIKLEDVS